MERALFVCKKFPVMTGGNIVTNSYYNSLKSIYKENLFLFEIAGYSSSYQKFRAYINGYGTSGLNKEIILNVIDVIINNNISIIYINSSFYGKLIRMIRSMNIKVKIVVFYHNIETMFIWGVFKRQYKISNLLALCSTYYAERMTTFYSDYRIGLNIRDSECLNKLFGYKFDFIIPLSIEDKFDISMIYTNQKEKNVGLFVGSDFFANYYGIKWFIENVSPYISSDINVVGRGLEKYRDKFSKFRNVNIIGSVDNLDDYYYNADFVISPIFDGSGMKTKTAEALMFGKTIIGTTEAFEGYLFSSDVGFICNDAESFIKVINNHNFEKYNSCSRSLYLENYSIKCLNEYLKEVNSIVKKMHLNEYKSVI